ncbi:conserved Plasmodium protein, unknown function [Plasmodium malariae]|uniref:Uncharacterized protein n=1 Tax=Plasmodium malariae TaxID=5858 RepID=A0A1C3KY29_PLAMA|nr:conserved Plasmodium protein, unknown function [Plasmodium malariae]
MNSHILKLCIFGLLYKITHYTSNQRNVLSFVRGQTDEHGNLNIDLKNPKYISVKNVLNNMLNTFEPIEQKAFINKLSDEINTRIKFYESFSI